ncbi:MAG: HAD family phosphatase [Acidobacteria bacterium]|nr:HAD family phosphatase [Acidobacteriota bacterium]
MSDAPVRAVIFDFGGVFIDSPFTALVEAAGREGLDPEVVLEVVFGPYEQDTDHPWHRLERGEVDLGVARDEIVAIAVDRIGRPIEPFDLLAALAGGGVREQFVDCCRAQRAAGRRTGLLTNNAAEFEEFWRPIIPLDELFDDVVDSSAVGLRKPDPRVYHLALERLGVSAAETVFVDDAPGNVVGARAVGMRAVLVGPQPDDVAVALAELDDLLA